MAGYDLAHDVWHRYQYLRDNGHSDYVLKTKKCEDFFAGLQWSPEDMALLRSVRRPALTINKILSTTSNVMGEQIYNRTETSFRPRNEEATDEIANVLTKVFMQIGYDNQLAYVRSDVFANGIIGSRGFYDVRLDFTQNLRGEVRITSYNPKNVLIDLDADEYDPDSWGDVILTKWMSKDDIEILFNKEAADELQAQPGAYTPYGLDVLDLERDRFGTPRPTGYHQGPETWRPSSRHVRVLERQWRKLDKIEHFVDIATATAKPVPPTWDRNRIAQYLAENPLTTITKKLVKRVRWTVTAGAMVLHDDWSPYQHFTIVPYFPHFRRGRTIGLVENLLGPQELLNKVSSQELHVVNTTANSGWKIKRGALLNMTTGELEQRGSQTGVVLELDEIANAEKITPNQTPSGLDRISYKAEEHIKTISGVPDAQTGFVREDVAAKAIKANQSAAQTGFAKILDNLNRTDYLLARNVLDIVQEYYTEQRIVHVTADASMMNQTQPMVVNQPSSEGKILNDLTLGKYEVVITTQPERDTFEDTQFDQAIGLREQGIQIPDKYIIQSSRLRDKNSIVQEMTSAQNSPEAQQMAQLNLRGKAAEVAKLEAEAKQKGNDATLRTAKAVQTMRDGQEPPDHALKMRELDHQHELEMQRLNHEHSLKQRQELLKRATELHKQAQGAKSNAGKSKAVH